MSDGAVDLQAQAKEARKQAYATPLQELNPAVPGLFQADAHWAYFERLRAEDPVHWTPAGDLEAHWGITRFNDIVAIDTNHQVFSSEGGITLPPSAARIAAVEAQGGGNAIGGMFSGADQSGQPRGPSMFIAMDPPKHDVQRKTVSPAVSPSNLAHLEPMIRREAGRILDSLPIGEPFDWVDRVSMELTAMTLATLFGISQEDRRRLTRWSDVVMAQPGHGVVDSWEQKRAEMTEYGMYFMKLWNERVNAPRPATSSPCSRTAKRRAGWTSSNTSGTSSCSPSAATTRPGTPSPARSMR